MHKEGTALVVSGLCQVFSTTGSRAHVQYSMIHCSDCLLKALRLRNLGYRKERRRITAVIKLIDQLF